MITLSGFHCIITYNMHVHLLIVITQLILSLYLNHKVITLSSFHCILMFVFQVLQFDNTYAGVILFVGQISDAISTVFVGYFSDAGDDLLLCRLFGRRKAWHVFGSLCLLMTFPFVFLKCVGCQDSSQVRFTLIRYA